MPTKSKEIMQPLKSDLMAALTIGIIAGALSPVIVNNLNIAIPWYYLFIFFVVICPFGIVIGRFLSKYIGLFYKLAKFGETGGLNWIVDLGVVNLLVLLTGVSIGLLPIVFKGISFIVAVINSYFWNKLWVFKGAKQQNQVQEASKFLIASLLGLGFNLIIFSAVKFGGPIFVSNIDAVKWVSIGTIVGSLAAMLFNFTLYKVWVFKD